MLGGFGNQLLGGSEDALRSYLEGHDAMRDRTRIKPWLEAVDDLEKRLALLKTPFSRPEERMMALIITLQWKAWVVRFLVYPASSLFTPDFTPRLSTVRTTLDAYLHRDFREFHSAEKDKQLEMLRLLTEAAQIRFAEHSSSAPLNGK